MRRDPGRITFGTGEGQPFLPGISNVALVISAIWEKRWNRAHGRKALWIDMHREDSVPSASLRKSFEYQDQRQWFVAEHLKQLLVDLKREVPAELLSYLDIRPSGSKERK